jgi:hypothetical protein
MRYLIIIGLMALVITGCTQPQSATQTQQAPNISQNDDPVDITDLDYQGLPVRIGIQGNEALPVQAILEAEQDLPVTLHMEKDQTLQDHHSNLPVEVTTIGNKPINIHISTENADPLPVAFGLPPIPPEMILPAALGGIALFLLLLLPCIAAIAAMKAARKAREITEMYFKQIHKDKDNPCTTGLLSVSMDENPSSGENNDE